MVAVLAGGAILFPSLALLFRLALTGRFRPRRSRRLNPPPAGLPSLRAGLLARVSAALLVAGFGVLTVADAGWAHAIGVVCLLAFVVTAFAAIARAP